MSLIRTDNDCGEGTLYCPGCGSMNLHHAKVTHFNAGIRTVVNDRTTTVNTYKIEEEKHHHRGESIRILFWCEQCGSRGKEDDMYSLLIAQHKGTTYMYWEF